MTPPSVSTKSHFQLSPHPNKASSRRSAPSFDQLGQQIQFLLKTKQIRLKSGLFDIKYNTADFQYLIIVILIKPILEVSFASHPIKWSSL